MSLKCAQLTGGEGGGKLGGGSRGAGDFNRSLLSASNEAANFFDDLADVNGVLEITVAPLPVCVAVPADFFGAGAKEKDGDGRAVGVLANQREGIEGLFSLQAEEERFGVDLPEEAEASLGVIGGVRGVPTLGEALDEWCEAPLGVI